MSEEQKSRNGRPKFEKDARVAKPRKQTHSRRDTAGENDAEDRATVNRTKTRLRSVRRLLENKHDDMPANQRIALEREHASLQHELQQRLDHAQRKKIISKYHMVRFFERKKAERLLKRAQKGAADDSDPKEVHRRQVDLNYTLYYPLTLAYASLYVKDKDAEAEPNRTSPVWEEVALAMETNTLNALRDRPAKKKGTLPSNYASDPRKKADKTGKTASKDRAIPRDNGSEHQVPEDEEGGSSSDDGGGAGFFE